MTSIARITIPVGAACLTFDQRYANYLSRLKTNAIDPGMGRALIARITTEF